MCIILFPTKVELSNDTFLKEFKINNLKAFTTILEHGLRLTLLNLLPVLFFNIPNQFRENIKNVVITFLRNQPSRLIILCSLHFSKRQVDCSWKWGPFVNSSSSEVYICNKNRAICRFSEICALLKPSNWPLLICILHHISKEEDVTVIHQQRFGNKMRQSFEPYKANSVLLCSQIYTMLFKEEKSLLIMQWCVKMFKCVDLVLWTFLHIVEFLIIPQLRFLSLLHAMSNVAMMSLIILCIFQASSPKRLISHMLHETPVRQGLPNSNNERLIVPT